MSTTEQQEMVPAAERGPGEGSVRVHQETSRSSRVYSLEFSFDGRTWREPLWSATTMLKSLDKPAIVYWAAREVAAAAFANLRYLAQDLERFGEREAIYQLSQAPWSRREKAADIGTAVHALIEAHVKGASAPHLDEDVREKALAHFAQFLAWEADYRPEYSEGGAEMTVVHPEHGWAGTLDIIARLGGRGLGVIDVKNTSPGGKKKDQPGVYPEHALQVAAYAHAAEIVPVRGVWAEPVPMPEISWGAVLWIAEDRHAFVEVNVSDATYRTFRLAGEIYRWQDGPGKRVIIGEQSPAVFGVLPTPDEQAAAVAGSPVISERQRKMMLGVAGKRGVDHAALKALIAERFPGVESTKKVPAAGFEALLQELEAMPEVTS